MENKEFEIQACRAEVQELTRRVNELSARIKKLEGEQVQAVTPAVKPYVPPVKRPVVQAPPAEKTDKVSRWQNLEDAVGKKLFAVLASLLVLLGVGVFISTIYEQIPEFVKIIAIYLFGFALLGSGLVLYSRKKNNFWLGVASCGLAELLVSIITSHSYFEVLSLPATFLLILVWIIATFRLAKVQPFVFKTIGYVGFTVSILLGLSLVTAEDMLIYLMLLASFALLAVSFMITHREHTVMNTVLAFCNVANLCWFLNMRSFLPEAFHWVSGVIAFLILGVFHGMYLFQSDLSRKAYPFFSIATLLVASLFLQPYDAAVQLPAVLLVVLALWVANSLVAENQDYRVCFAGFAAVCLFGFADNVPDYRWMLFFWYAGFVAVAYILYFFTKKRDIAWLGFVCFAIFYLNTNAIHDVVLVLNFAAALAFFVLNSSKLLRKDDALQTAWYVLVFIIAHSLKTRMLVLIHESGTSSIQLAEIGNSIFYALYTMINTAYLHTTIADKTKILRITGKGIVLMVLQGILFLNCMIVVDSGIWYVALMGVAASMLILAYSLHYTYKTKGNNRNLMVWQFVKFTLYSGLVLTILDSPDLLLNIVLLLLAILAVIVGFRLDQKSVRIYGLVLSLVDVVSLVLFNVDYSDSLQFAGGIVLCGALCFVISFIYSKISKATNQAKAVSGDAERSIDA